MKIQSYYLHPDNLYRINYLVWLQDYFLRCLLFIDELKSKGDNNAIKYDVGQLIFLLDSRFFKIQVKKLACK